MSEDLEEIIPRLSYESNRVPHASPSSGTPQLVQQPRESQSLCFKEEKKGLFQGVVLRVSCMDREGKAQLPSPSWSFTYHVDPLQCKSGQEKDYKEILLCGL